MPTPSLRFHSLMRIHSQIRFLLLLCAVALCAPQVFARDIRKKHFQTDDYFQTEDYFQTIDGAAVLVCDPHAAPVERTAAEMFTADWQRVFPKALMRDTLLQEQSSGSTGICRIVAATIGSSLLSSFSVPATLRGAHEAFELFVAADGTLVVAGSDAHGTAYGLLDLSRQIGVSPWEWWADAAPAQRTEFSLPAGYRKSERPSVAYRGIFINDEDWGLTPWSWQTNEPAGGSYDAKNTGEKNTVERGTVEKGTVGPRTTERIFQLLLRLRANTYWPPMHGCSRPFFLTPGNREVAARYGIYIGTSHCEPMACNANGEWAVRGKGEYNIKTNRDAVLAFWRERADEVAGQEVVYTLGMRGVHDSGILGARNAAERKALTEEAIAAQRQMIAQTTGRDAATVPQVFIPYKEVLDAYRDGLQVPDDVTLMWCDDNYGYVRHFPTPQERARRGGNGLYYHASYWGRPHDYLWLGTQSPSLMMQQLLAAFDGGICRMWILNVGDIKPLEYQTELFMDMAWDIEAVRNLGAEQHLRSFLAREFGHKAAGVLTPALMEHYRLALIRKPEFLGGTRTEEKDPRWKQVRDLPWTNDYITARLADYLAITDAVEKARTEIEPRSRDAFFHLAEYPLRCAALMNQKMLTSQLRRHNKTENKTENDAVWAAADTIASLTARYNALQHGKWRGMMDAAPRRLPVFLFTGAEADTLPTPVAAWQPTEDILSVINGADFSERHSGKKNSGNNTYGKKTTCNLALGYQGKAVELAENQTIEYTFDTDAFARDNIKNKTSADDKTHASDSLQLLLCFLPTHPTTDDAGLRVETSIDGCAPVVTDHATVGRSEEWKENVLANRAVRMVKLPLRQKGKKTSRRTLTIKALTGGVVLDQVIIMR